MSNNQSKGQTFYFTDFFNNIRLPGVRSVFLRRCPDLYNSVSILFHIVALFVSAIYIQDAYNNFQNSLIVQSLTYMNVKDMPFPAITVCEPVLLKDEYNRFEILKRCMSLENGTSWLCSEDELNMFMISTDIYPLYYDFLPMTDEEATLLSTLSEPFTENTVQINSVRPNQSFRGVDYFNYIGRLGEELTNTFQIYNPDFPNSPYRSEVLRSGSALPERLLAPYKIYENGIYICKTINSVRHRGAKMKDNDSNKNNILPSLDCVPENIFDDVCKNYLLFTDNHLELKFNDIDVETEFRNYLLRISYSELAVDDFELSDKRVEFQRYIVFVHSNFDHPSMTVTEYQRILRGSVAAISITPTVTHALKNLAEVEESKRNCAFSHERSLSLFEVYTHNNCVFECQINCSLTLCGCIPFGTAIMNSSHPICSTVKADTCQKENKALIFHEFHDKLCKCDCPLDCFTISYSTTVDVDYGALRNTTLQISYAKDSVLSVIRYSVTSPAEFVAYSLGILGVFNGFTMKVVYDLLYWLTLGLWSTIRNIALTSTHN
ncbi:uncharacterized protein LOC128996624 [Macrosteles quadrilineatus]|uniref:uncharacterized protein LOC128996624 n=1 Tax=Macrosteles quadrilineatus TaxID=74068 RepID=UPI0023E314D4|nr:uncharacterized protein LOC128996624 [Macrosteles quadrilineatus]